MPHLYLYIDQNGKKVLNDFIKLQKSSEKGPQTAKFIIKISIEICGKDFTTDDIFKALILNLKEQFNFECDFFTKKTQHSSLSMYETAEIREIIRSILDGMCVDKKIPLNKLGSGYPNRYSLDKKEEKSIDTIKEELKQLKDITNDELTGLVDDLRNIDKLTLTIKTRKRQANQTPLQSKKTKSSSGDKRTENLGIKIEENFKRDPVGTFSLLQSLIMKLKPNLITEQACQLGISSSHDSNPATFFGKPKNLSLSNESDNSNEVHDLSDNESAILD